ncbi:Oidioi.mRNA.OKI2018_I69.PAR.g9524.t1.cds [Oikopleura dioica]|uniref:Oidioi.mRNA.OKI2018_I69.PAR.g9524.t1.cds n=1 Tax=Oikopleura dioica TaxID=34765 RepID=A0ABN7RRW8_OIKDI|nr:Oidioi.mRNA.OKI2018_I69.PAR.g9524.t1.cds [Oikopleura dioica]
MMETKERIKIPKPSKKQLVPAILIVIVLLASFFCWLAMFDFNIVEKSHEEWETARIEEAINQNKEMMKKLADDWGFFDFRGDHGFAQRGGPFQVYDDYAKEFTIF